MFAALRNTDTDASPSSWAEVFQGNTGPKKGYVGYSPPYKGQDQKAQLIVAFKSQSYWEY